MSSVITWARLTRIYLRCGAEQLTAAKRAARFVWRDH